MLGNPVRIRILLLLIEQDANVSDLAEQLGMTQSAVSHQLNLLKSNKMVRRRRDGKMIFYYLLDGQHATSFFLILKSLTKKGGRLFNTKT
ncbi:MAG: winged helix-turn-helix transcriptional regulator [Lachnospiraceae bacterium]|nr:winged helix-turn-helix transcriptional regulator [Lachnospiraceae bacterium]